MQRHDGAANSAFSIDWDASIIRRGSCRWQARRERADWGHNVLVRTRACDDRGTCGPVAGLTGGLGSNCRTITYSNHCRNIIDVL
jgi:hypothetical protein